MGNFDWGGKRQGAGRPRGIKRPYQTLSIAVTVENAEKIRALAKESGLSMAKYITLKVLGEEAID